MARHSKLRRKAKSTIASADALRQATYTKYPEIARIVDSLPYSGSRIPSTPDLGFSVSAVKGPGSNYFRITVSIGDVSAARRANSLHDFLAPSDWLGKWTSKFGRLGFATASRPKQDEVSAARKALGLPANGGLNADLIAALQGCSLAKLKAKMGPVRDIPTEQDVRAYMEARVTWMYACLDFVFARLTRDLADVKIHLADLEEEKILLGEEQELLTKRHAAFISLGAISHSK